jgi:hypothetical protein
MAYTGSYRNLGAVGAILAEMAPAAALLGALLATVALWQRHSPAAFPPRRGAVETEVIRAQMERAEVIPADPDVLLVGDSSGLMGIDAERLADLLGGAKVESLNMLGFVGPRGFAAVLERFIARGGHVNRLLVVFQGQSLNRPVNWRNWERVVIRGSWDVVPPDRWFPGVRARLLAAAAPILYVPMDGRLGDYYGPASALRRFIRTHHGSAIEPGVRGSTIALFSLRPGFALTKEFLDGVDALKEPVEQIGRARTRLILMPDPDAYDSEDVLRKRYDAEQTLLRRLQLDPALQIETPSFVSSADFATATHLNPVGRERFTGMLADKLKEDRRQNGW